MHQAVSFFGDWATPKGLRRDFFVSTSQGLNWNDYDKRTE